MVIRESENESDLVSVVRARKISAAVYTEYTVRVDEVLKQYSAAPIITGGFVDAPRPVIEGGLRLAGVLNSVFQ